MCVKTIVFTRPKRAASRAAARCESAFRTRAPKKSRPSAASPTPKRAWKKSATSAVVRNPPPRLSRANSAHSRATMGREAGDSRAPRRARPLDGGRERAVERNGGRQQEDVEAEGAGMAARRQPQPRRARPAGRPSGCPARAPRPAARCSARTPPCAPRPTRWREERPARGSAPRRGRGPSRSASREGGHAEGDGMIDERGHRDRAARAEQRSSDQRAAAPDAVAGQRHREAGGRGAGQAGGDHEARGRAGRGRGGPGTRRAGRPSSPSPSRAGTPPRRASRRSAQARSSSAAHPRHLVEEEAQVVLARCGSS